MMTMMAREKEAPPGEVDPERLLVKLNSHEPLEEGELESVAEALRLTLSQTQGRRLSLDDVYSYVLVIGRARAEQYRDLLEAQLEQKDTFTAALILEILCLEWGRTEEYLERVLHFALGVAWDDEQDVQNTALKILGEYLHAAMRKEKDRRLSLRTREVLMLLLSVFDDESVEHWSRQNAYVALLRASGAELEDLPSECAWLSLESDSEDIDWECLKGLRRRAESG